MRGRKEGVDLRLRESERWCTSPRQTRRLAPPTGTAHRRFLPLVLMSNERMRKTQKCAPAPEGKIAADRIDSIGFGARALLASLENALRPACAHPFGATWC